MSSDALLLAGELGDISSAMRRLAEAVAAIRPEVTITAAAAAPVVNVAAPELAAPQIVVPVPAVNIAPAQVNVAAARPVAYVVRITERDLDGLVAAFTLTPVA